MINGLCRYGRIHAASLAVGLALIVVAPLAAQPAGDSKLPSVPPQQGVIIGGTPSQTQTFERCVDVQVGGEKNAFGCLNEKLKREVNRVNPSINLPPLDARSSDIRVGNVNEAAIREQYGSNYGRSVIPFRPPAASYGR